ncbi:MAG: AbrB/MazE/SpoVT family DNA-binding domain-containing protein [Candidatus Riflebacteria bacterium]|nr:AbrB/MazE/SpoVT family DNA-binding domain-containing protein [Candidatus Riflebacteria bacterium]
MKGTMTAKVDNKGRLSLPQDLRALLHIEAGDVFFIETDKNDVLRLAKAENPFDVLAKQAMEESKAGKTITLEEFEQKMRKSKRSKK